MEDLYCFCISTADDFVAVPQRCRPFLLPGVLLGRHAEKDSRLLHGAEQGVAEAELRPQPMPGGGVDSREDGDVDGLGVVEREVMDESGLDAGGAAVLAVEDAGFLGGHRARRPHPQQCCCQGQEYNEQRKTVAFHCMSATVCCTLS